MIAPAFAIDDDCEDNGDNSCLEENQKVHQENKCKIVNEIENEENSDSNENRDVGTGNIQCWNFAQNPERDAINDEFPPGPPGPG
jgi:hypothetical protein